MTTVANIKWYINWEEWWVNEIINLLSLQDIISLWWWLNSWSSNINWWCPKNWQIVLDELNSHAQEYYDKYSNEWYMGSSWYIPRPTLFQTRWDFDWDQTIRYHIIYFSDPWSLTWIHQSVVW